MIARFLSFVGFILLLLALVGFIFLSTRSFPRASETLRLARESFQATGATPTPAKTTTPSGDTAPTPTALPIVPPQLLSPLPGQELDAGLVLLTGLAQPGAMVEITLDGQVVEAVQADSQGNWAAELSLTTPGTYLLELNTAPANGVPAQSSGPIQLIVGGSGTAAEPTATATAAAAPPSTPTPDAAATPPLLIPVTGGQEPQPLPTVVILADWPVKLDVNAGAPFMVKLAQVMGQEAIPTVNPTARRTTTAATAIPIARSTPGAPIEAAFGPQYTALVSASLTDFADVLTIRPMFDEAEARQALSQGAEIEWAWFVTPKRKATPFVRVKIEVAWVAQDNGPAPPAQELWRKEINTIEVAEPFTSQVNLANVILTAVAGSLFNVPMLFKLGQKLVKSPQFDTEASYRRTLKTLTGNLAVLEERTAQYGLDVPLKLVNEMEETRQKIAETEAKLAGLEPSTDS
jgi:hypothetical protein